MRSSAEVLDREGERALADALDDLAMPLQPSSGTESVRDWVVDGHPVRLAVHGATVIDAARVAPVTERTTPADAIPVVVGDRILSAARPLLNRAGWSWLDRRGHLHLRAPGVLIDTEIDPLPRERPRRRPSDVLDSRGSQEVAITLLLDPAERLGVRDMARRTGFAPSTISRSQTALRDAGLVHRDGRPVIPDLFWALAEHWLPDWIALATPMSSADPGLDELGAHLTDLTVDGWAVGDTRGALAWRAPIVASADAAAAIYLPDRVTLDRVIDRWGRASGERPTIVGRVAVVPSAAVARRRFRRAGEPWPVVHPLFVALDLAADRARGHQILDEWEPTETPHVW
jgi:hypothetical protein